MYWFPQGSDLRILSSEEHLCFCWEHQPGTNEFYLCKMTCVIKNRHESRRPEVSRSSFLWWIHGIGSPITSSWCVFAGLSESTFSENPHAVVFFGFA